MKPISAIRGMNDTLPKDATLWQWVEMQLKNLATQFGFQEIRFPVLEKTELFLRSVGDHTDIVQKEMYTFLDRNQDSLSLRPEGTASCVRAGIEHGLLYNQTAKLWYNASFFRYERPQKGRLRQFHQFGTELFGFATPDSDAELLLLCHAIFSKLNLPVQLEINSLGCKSDRVRYKEKLVNYFSAYQTNLNEEEKQRLSHNPLRLLDSKNPQLQEIIQAAPKLMDYLDEDARAHFESLQFYLHELNIPFIINPKLVRGLDYYNKTVFEWTTTELGAQNTVCAGGRYDDLVAQLGGQPTPALGFGLGLERLILLLSERGMNSKKSEPMLYFICENDVAKAKALSLSQMIRNHFPNWCVLTYLGNQAFKQQFKKADQSGAHYACIIGESELQTGEVTLKSLRTQAEQIRIPEKALLSTLEKLSTQPEADDE